MGALIWIVLRFAFYVLLLTAWGLPGLFVAMLLNRFADAAVARWAFRTYPDKMNAAIEKLK